MAPQAVESNIEIEDARIIFRNFKGEKSKFNPTGFRTFSVLLDDDLAEVLARDGWNIKWLDPREEGDKPQAFMDAKAQYGPYPPKVVLVTNDGLSYIGEDEIDMLDWAEFEKVDLVLRPYNWEVSGNTGVAAYLKAIYVTLVEDAFEAKYRNLHNKPMDLIVPDEDEL